MTSKGNQKPPFRDVIREKNAVAHANERLAEFEAQRRDDNFSYAVWTGRLTVVVADLLAVVENLQAVADHAEGDAR